MIDNYIQVGIVRAVNTVLMVCAMAFGIVMAMRLLAMEDVVIDKKFSELEHGSARSLLYIRHCGSHIRDGLLHDIQYPAPSVVGGCGGESLPCVRVISSTSSWGSVRSSVLSWGAMVVSLVAVKAVHWFHVPNHVLHHSFRHSDDSGSVDVPCAGGAHQYARVVGEVTVAVSNGINASLIILCIALG